MEMFVIQIRPRPEETAEACPREPRGVVEHVGSGSRRPFADTRDLLAFLGADYRELPKEVKR